MSILIDKIEAQKKRLEELAGEKPVFATWLKQLIAMEEIVLKSEGMLKLKRNPVFKEFISLYEKNIEKIDKKLSGQRSMSTEERDLLFIQKDFNQTFIDLFSAKSQVLKSIEKRVKDATNNLKKYGY